MSWNLIGLALPAYSVTKFLSHLNPAAYKKWDGMPKSDRTDAVHAIVERVLQAENRQGSEHFDRIQDMLKDLPGSAGPKTLPALIQYRFKVVKEEREESSACVAGCDSDAQNGKYYISVNPNLEEGWLPFIITHEVSHILNDDTLTLLGVKAVASSAVAGLSVFAFGWSLLSSLSAVILTHCVTHAICSRSAEGAADTFAIKHCSKEQLEQGIAYLESIKTRRSKGCYVGNWMTAFLHPSDKSRIAKINAVLQPTGNSKSVSLGENMRSIFLKWGGVFLTACSSLPAVENKPVVSKELSPIVLSDVQGIAWVRKIVAQYPEILWLADANVRKTEEGQATMQGTYSEQLFGQKFIEFDRTLMTLHCLRLILDGSDAAYQQFTSAQPSDAKLSRSSFEKLHLEGRALLRSKWEGLSESEMIRAMEASLVLGDMGKSEKAREIFKPYGAKAPDHDDFHGEAMQILEQHPNLCPTFNRLTPSAQNLLKETANLAHYGHVTHIEGGPSMFSRLKASGLASAQPKAFAFDFFVHTCDVAGALGHVNNQSSLVYTELAHRAMQAVMDACGVLADPQKTEADAYNAYLAIRANWLGLDPNDRTDRALTRMGAMLRLFTPEDGLLLKQAVLKLDPEERAKIIEQLDVQKENELARTPTYMPAVLVNLSNHPQLGASREERISQAVVLGLPFLSRVLEAHKQSLAELRANPDIPLNFNKAAGVAKQAPDLLRKEFAIDAEGNVCCKMD